ncbi:lecithin retinol acyltransferase family protein [Pseudomonas sp. MYb118]|uniref:lecithin retinol acyltransferase family protein n=1 Tax=Pseudomonas sp. MYb118 TaxID=1848720 RepID=UPI0034CF8E32
MNTLAMKLTSGCLDLMQTDAQADNLPVGCHLVSPRGFYLHHGIYLGGGEVIHYSGFSGSFRAGPVEVVGLEQFANGRSIWIVQEAREYSDDEVVSRARSRVGESRYSVFSNNCEHFCNWCISGKSCSAQIRALFHYPRYWLSLVSALHLSFIA